MARDAALFRSLAAMHRAGIPWPRAVESVAGDDPRVRPVIAALEHGASFATAFAPVVDPLDRALFEAAEHGGSLEQTLEAVADAHEEADQRRRERSVRQAYPVFLGHVAAVLMALPDLIRGRPLAALGWALLVLLPLWGWLALQRVLDRRERPSPPAGRPSEPPAPRVLVGPLRSRVEEADARGLEALGRLYEAGVPLGEALELALAAGWGGRVAQDLAEARGRVQRGEDLAGAFRHAPPAAARRIRAAEESGSLGAELVRLASELRFGVDVRRRRALQLLPIALMLALGALVALRLFAFYGDLYGRIVPR